MVNRGKTFINPSAQLFLRNTHILRSEGHVFLYLRGNDLIIRILKDHAGSLPDL